MTVIDRSRGWRDNTETPNPPCRTRRVDSPLTQPGHVDIEAAAIYVQYVSGRPCPHATIRSWAARGLLTRHGRDRQRRGLYDLNELHKLATNRPDGPGHPRLDTASYRAVHKRLDADRGPASTHPCTHCGDPARDWAYDHNDPDELTAQVRGGTLAYSLDQDRYIPLCKLCHQRFDVKVAK